jgi:hypothetical protein
LLTVARPMDSGLTKITICTLRVCFHVVLTHSLTSRLRFSFD